MRTTSRPPRCSNDCWRMRWRRASFATRRLQRAKRRPRPCGGSAIRSRTPSARPGRRRSTISRCPSRRCRASCSTPPPLARRVSKARARAASAISATATSISTSAPPAGVEPERWFAETAPEVTRFVDDLVVAAGGSISAEHGIGQMKIGELERLSSPSRLAALRARSNRRLTRTACSTPASSSRLRHHRQTNRAAPHPGAARRPVDFSEIFDGQRAAASAFLQGP